MKKRLLALALCLVMMTSLLPLTAAAATYNLTSVTIKASGVEKRSDGYYVILDGLEGTYDGGTIDIEKYGNLSAAGALRGLISTSPIDYSGMAIPLDKSPEKGKTYYVSFRIYSDELALNNSFSAQLKIPGYTTELQYWYIRSNGWFELPFSLTKVHEHNWQFTVSESGDSLTSKCLEPDCFIDPANLSLSAHSVTLPDSPFNAQLAGEKEFQAAFPNAAISKIRYDYKGSDGVWHKDVDPVAANAKAGEYQAFVEISNLPGTVVDESGNILNQNGEASLFVKYTAVDPKVTAQTGDNRPIELMLAGVVVFSALAAAAFILDNKRKYSR